MSQTDETTVCISDKGGILPPSRISRWRGYPGLKGFRNQIGFPDLVMHELRHTQATMLLGNGIDIKTVQARLGHAKAKAQVISIEEYESQTKRRKKRVTERKPRTHGKKSIAQPEGAKMLHDANLTDAELYDEYACKTDLCPICGSRDIHFDVEGIDDGRITQQGLCHQCHSIWTEVYRYERAIIESDGRCEYEEHLGSLSSFT